MKSYTDIEQSKKLAEFLSIESADMWWVALNWQETEYYVEVKQDGINQPKKVIPCWSLAALLDVLPKYIGDYSECLYYDDGSYYCGYMDDGDFMLTIKETKASNPIDACVEVIERLYKLNLL